MNHYGNYSLSESMRTFMYKVYGWMSVGLLTTAVTAYAIAQNQQLFHSIFSSNVAWIFIIAQVLLAFALGLFINYMNFATAMTVFLAYTGLTGVTLSTIFYVYNIQAIALSFGITCAMFTMMALYGYFTKADLTTAGSMAQMALWGIILSLFVNMFMQSPALDYIISLIAVGIFTILIAYDTQKLKELGYHLTDHEEVAAKASIRGALMLYLDFINLFLHLLRIIGGTKRSE